MGHPAASAPIARCVAPPARIGDGEDYGAGTHRRTDSGRSTHRARRDARELRSRRELSFGARCADRQRRSEEHTSELQSLMRISYAVFCLKKKKIKNHRTKHT